MSDKSAWTAYAQSDDGNADALAALQDAEGAPHASSDLLPQPALYAELDRLRAEVERLEAEHMELRLERDRQWERAGRAVRRVVTKTRALRAENARLRAALEQIIAEPWPLTLSGPGRRLIEIAREAVRHAD